MPDKLLARDIMIPFEEYPHLDANCKVCDAIMLMHQNLDTVSGKYRTILVTDGNLHLLGYLSLRDLIRAIGPDYLKKEAPNYKGHQPFHGISVEMSALALIWQSGITEKIKKEAEKPVSDVMTLIDFHVDPNASFAKCVTTILFNNEQILPVKESNQVIGVIRLVDLFERIAVSICPSSSATS